MTQDYTLKPGETGYLRAPSGEKVTIWQPKDRSYVKVVASGVYVPPPVEPPPPTGGTVRLCPVGYTAEQFVNMMRDATIDEIQMEAGVRSWSGITFVKDLSRKTRPLTVRYLPGVIFDGNGGSGGLLHFNTLNGPGVPSVPVEDISFVGSHTIRNFRLGATGLIMLGWVNRFGYHDAIVRDVTGSGNTSHALYVNSDEAHRASQAAANRWDILSNKTIAALQTYHEPQIDGLTAQGWKVDGCHRACYLYHNATGIVIDGWDIRNCTATIDAEGVATGVVKNCVATNSGPLAKGQGYWLAPGIVDGGGNRVV